LTIVPVHKKLAKFSECHEDCRDFWKTKRSATGIGKQRSDMISKKKYNFLPDDRCRILLFLEIHLDEYADSARSADGSWLSACFPRSLNAHSCEIFDWAKRL